MARPRRWRPDRRPADGRPPPMGGSPAASCSGSTSCAARSSCGASAAATTRPRSTGSSRAILAALSGRGPMPVNEAELDTTQFGLVPGGYFEAEVDAGAHGGPGHPASGAEPREQVGRRSERRARAGRRRERAVQARRVDGVDVGDRRARAGGRRGAGQLAGRCGAGRVDDHAATRTTAMPIEPDLLDACPRGCRTASARASIATTTAPIRPALRLPGLCWSGSVTGSSPATSRSSCARSRLPDQSGTAGIRRAVRQLGPVASMPSCDRRRGR